MTWNCNTRRTFFWPQSTTQVSTSELSEDDCISGQCHLFVYLQPQFLPSPNGLSNPTSEIVGERGWWQHLYCGKISSEPSWGRMSDETLCLNNFSSNIPYWMIPKVVENFQSLNNAGSVFMSVRHGNPAWGNVYKSNALGSCWTFAHLMTYRFWLWAFPAVQ
jgi:hypothetical protein